MSTEENIKPTSEASAADSSAADRSLSTQGVSDSLQDFAAKEVWSKDARSKEGGFQERGLNSPAGKQASADAGSMLNDFQLTDNSQNQNKVGGSDKSEKDAGQKADKSVSGKAEKSEKTDAPGSVDKSDKTGKSQNSDKSYQTEASDKTASENKESVVERGGSKISLDSKGEISKVETPNGISIEKDGNGWKSNNGAVDNVSRDAQGNVQIDWAVNKNGVTETTTIRPSGLESVYNPPQKSGNTELRSEELNPKAGGGFEVIAKTSDNKVIKGELDANGQLTGKNEKIDRLSDVSTPEQLDKVAGELARIIDKNGGKFGNAYDKNYFSQAEKAFQRNGKSLEFEDKVSDALKSRNSQFHLSEFSTRRSETQDFSIGQKGKAGVLDRLSLPKGR